MSTSKQFNREFSELSSKMTAGRKAANTIADAVEATAGRVKLVCGHLKEGGKLSSRQKAQLSAPERAIVAVYETTQDPQVRKSVETIHKKVVRGFSDLQDIVKKAANGN